MHPWRILYKFSWVNTSRGHCKEGLDKNPTVFFPCADHISKYNFLLVLEILHTTKVSKHFYLFHTPRVDQTNVLFRLIPFHVNYLRAVIPFRFRTRKLYISNYESQFPFSCYRFTSWSRNVHRVHVQANRRGKRGKNVFSLWQGELLAMICV